MFCGQFDSSNTAQASPLIVQLQATNVREHRLAGLEEDRQRASRLAGIDVASMKAMTSSAGGCLEKTTLGPCPSSITALQAAELAQVARGVLTTLEASRTRSGADRHGAARRARLGAFVEAEWLVRFRGVHGQDAGILAYGSAYDVAVACFTRLGVMR
jgi:hypothetical protein